jgi:hypothetical protein
MTEAKQGREWLVVAFHDRRFLSERLSGDRHDTYSTFFFFCSRPRPHVSYFNLGATFVPPLARAADCPTRCPRSPHRRAHAQLSTAVIAAAAAQPPAPALVPWTTSSLPARPAPSMIFSSQMPQRRPLADARILTSTAMVVSRMLSVRRR